VKLPALTGGGSDVRQGFAAGSMPVMPKGGIICKAPRIRNSKKMLSRMPNMKQPAPSKIEKDDPLQHPVGPAPISCCIDELEAKESAKPAVAFLQKYGDISLVSLGCGPRLNLIDNHLRLMKGLNLKYYVGIDCHTRIEAVFDDLSMDPQDTFAMLNRYYQGGFEAFWQAIRLFPGTYVEELAGLHCAAVVCQRVLPDCRWEDVIISINPKLVLQEDLHGCERQQLRGQRYVRTLSNIRHYGLRPFRPWPIFPKENNLVLWRRRDFGASQAQEGKLRWLRRLVQDSIG